MAALADILPDKVMAPGSANSSFTIAGEDAGRRYAAVNFMNAGQGATAARDGLSTISFPSNLGNTPIEVMETQAPVRVLYRRTRKGSGGEGAHRGGNGLDFSFEFCGTSPAVVSFMMTRIKSPPPGLAGGEPGQIGKLELNGNPVDPAQHWLLQPGDRVVMQSAGGGGFGAVKG
jgi:N-methylhydantoinase B